MKHYSEKAFHPNASDLNYETYGEGMKYYKATNFRKAVNSFKVALEYWPLDPKAWFALGNCYDELEKPSKAEECFRKALKYTAPSKQANVYYNLANSLYDQEKLEEAIECYRKVDDQNKVYVSAQKNLLLAKNEFSNKDT